MIGSALVLSDCNVTPNTYVFDPEFTPSYYYMGAIIRSTRGSLQSFYVLPDAFIQMTHEYRIKTNQ